MKDNKILTTYKNYAPKNISFQQFEKMIEDDPTLLDAIGGKFSTNNPELTQLSNGNHKLSNNDLRKKLADSLNPDVMTQIAEQHAKLYVDIICSNDDILLNAFIFDILNEQERENLAIKIIKEINKHFNISSKLNIVYKNKKDIQTLIKEDILNLILKILSKIKHKNYSMLDYTGYYNQRKNKIFMLNISSFLYFINALSHEYGHFIDYKYPNLGMLGAQISAYAKSVYSSTQGHEIYKSNASEISSYKIGNTVEKYMTDTLTKQIKIKPNIFAKALNILIDYTKTKIAALRFKHNKLFHELEKAQQEFENAKSKIGSIYLNDDNDDIDGYQYAFNHDPEIQRTFKKLQQTQNKLPSEFKTLQQKLNMYESILKKSQQSDTKHFDFLIRLYTNQPLNSVL